MQVPSPDCPLCPRLVAFRNEQRDAFPDWFNAPVPSFGPLEAALLIVGLAPGMRGANRTGRPFTGDFAGELLYGTLIETGFADGVYEARTDDSLRLRDCRITNAVRCLPPQNRPVGREIATCRAFLQEELELLPRLRIVVALGRVAHESVVRALGSRLSAYTFAHGAEHDLGRFVLFDSYHCSRYNTQTGRLTAAMFHEIFERVRHRIDDGAAGA